MEALLASCVALNSATLIAQGGGARPPRASRSPKGRYRARRSPDMGGAQAQVQSGRLRVWAQALNSRNKPAHQGARSNGKWRPLRSPPATSCALPPHPHPADPREGDRGHPGRSGGSAPRVARSGEEQRRKLRGESAVVRRELHRHHGAQEPPRLGLLEGGSGEKAARHEGLRPPRRGQEVAALRGDPPRW